MNDSALCAALWCVCVACCAANEVAPLSMNPAPYTIDVSGAPVPPEEGHLDLGGMSKTGESISVNSRYIVRDGKPLIPVVGEFHYSRYPSAYWEEELLKMKAGGVTVVATYVFWNLHERTEGHFDWSGDLDLRRFVSLINKAGLNALIRIGPFAHGEMRNGGLPDWLFGKAFEVRSNDPAYLAQVEKLYAAIATQLGGLLYRDGGPVIGIQVENEFQHSAAPWELNYPKAPVQLTVAERDLKVTHGGVSVSTVANSNSGYGQDHMVNLKVMAKRAGLDVPLYTATGWGNAAIVPLGSIPVTAGYPYPFWTEVAEPSPFYLFKDLQRLPDYAPVSFEAERYPSLPAELGAGIQPTYSRRPYVPDESVEPMIVRVLGSGSNGVGYYMYHGGATPVYDTYMSEEASGLSKINYDYQAPLGQYGRTKGHFKSLGLVHRFLASYGQRLAPLPSVLPASNAALTAGNVSSLRFAARAAQGCGFLFLLNFQDHAPTRDLEGLVIEAFDGKSAVRFPSTGNFTLKNGACAIFPINLPMEGGVLKSATVQPLSILEGPEGRHFLFFSIDGIAPELVFASGSISDALHCRVETVEGVKVVRGEGGECFSFRINGTPVLVVPRSLALNAADAGAGRIAFSEALLLPMGDRLELVSAGSSVARVHVYPELKTAPVVNGASVRVAEPLIESMSAFDVIFQPVEFATEIRRVSDRKYAVHFKSQLRGLRDVYMKVHYTGDWGMAFAGGRLIDDHFYSGRVWEIGLKRFAETIQKEDLILVFQSLRRGATYLDDIPTRFRPEFKEGVNSVLSFDGIEFEPEYGASLLMP